MSGTGAGGAKTSPIHFRAPTPALRRVSTALVDLTDPEKVTLVEMDEAALASAEVRWANDLPTGEFQLTDGELIPIAAAREPASDESVATHDDPPYAVEAPGDPEEITLEGDRIEISGVYRVPESLPDPVAAPEEVEPLIEPAAVTVACMARSAAALAARWPLPVRLTCSRAASIS